MKIPRIFDPIAAALLKSPLSWDFSVADCRYDATQILSYHANRPFHDMNTRCFAYDPEKFVGRSVDGSSNGDSTGDLCRVPETSLWFLIVVQLVWIWVVSAPVTQLMPFLSCLHNETNIFVQVAIICNFEVRPLVADSNRKNLQKRGEFLNKLEMVAIRKRKIWPCMVKFPTGR